MCESRRKAEVVVAVTPTTPPAAVPPLASARTTGAPARPPAADASPPTSNSYRRSSVGVNKPKSKSGRKSSVARDLFDPVADPPNKPVIGSKCKNCEVVVKDQQRGATVFACHVYNSKKASYASKAIAFENYSAPSRTCTSPVQPLAPLPTPMPASMFYGTELSNAVNIPSKDAPSSRNEHQPLLTTFLD